MNLTAGIMLLLISGLTAVTLIDTLGSITSRKWNYNYAYLSLLSFLVYGLLGYFGHGLTGSLRWSMVIAIAAGLYDATVGHEISHKLKANFGKLGTQTSLRDRIVVMIFFSGGLAYLGYKLYG
jgi:cytochrome c oxidase subunit IV